MKPTLLVPVLLAALLGFTACAKYPVVVGSSGHAAPPPTTAAPAPTR